MRHPAVAGRFYQGTKITLKKDVERCFVHPLGPGELPSLGEGIPAIKGLVQPHAGYMFSGAIAAHGYHSLFSEGVPDVFVVIGPNHTGYGSAVSMTDETFLTPLGEVEVDKELLESMESSVAMKDDSAHRYEHSVEVQLPFIQNFVERPLFLPLVMMDQSIGTATALGQALAKALEGRNAVVIASTDFSHYVPKQEAERKDKIAIDRILELDVKGLYSVIRKEGLSMCGYGPVAAMLTAVQGSQAKLLKYATSGDVQPMQEVVGYASIEIR